MRRLSDSARRAESIGGVFRPQLNHFRSKKPPQSQPASHAKTPKSIRWNRCFQRLTSGPKRCPIALNRWYSDSAERAESIGDAFSSHTATLRCLTLGQSWPPEPRPTWGRDLEVEFCGRVCCRSVVKYIYSDSASLVLQDRLSRTRLKSKIIIFYFGSDPRMDGQVTDFEVDFFVELVPQWLWKCDIRTQRVEIYQIECLKSEKNEF